MSRIARIVASVVSHVSWASSLLVASLVVSYGCQQPKVRELTAPIDPKLSTWEDVFVEREIRLRLPEGSPPLLRVAQFVTGLNGEYFVPDGRSSRILVIHSDGEVVREIRSGEDHGLTVLGGLTVDPQGNLVMYDPVQQSITVLSQPSNNVVRAFSINAPLSALVALRDGSIVTYFPASDKAFRKFDSKGREVATAYRVSNKRLGIFHGRVQNGGLVRTSDHQLVGVHPAAFELIRLSEDLGVVEILRGAGNDPWAPTPIKLPEHLSPYNYQRGHEEWWNSFLHIGAPYALAEELILVTLFQSAGLAEGRHFANVYHIDGQVLARGLEVPHGGRVVGTAGRRVFVARNAQIGDDEAVKPVELYEYRLRPEMGWAMRHTERELREL